VPDRIEEALGALRVDVDRTGLAGADDVRRRGDRRTRHQVAAGGLALVLAIGVAVGVGWTGGDDRSLENVPATPTTDEPTVSTTQQPLLTLSGTPFLRDGDLTGIGPYGDFRDSGEQPSYRLMQCLDVPRLAGTGRVSSTVLSEPDIGEPTVHEHAVELGSIGAAADFVTRTGEAFATCDEGDPAEVTVTDRGPEPVGGADDGLRASRLSVPTADAGIGYYELGVARRGNIVVVLEWSSMGNPAGDGPSDWVMTPERLRTAMDRAAG
jgi:hypothetical protein